MEKKTIVIGGAVLIGFLALIGIVGSGGEEPTVEDVVAEELAPISDSMAALNERIAAMESSLDGVTEQIAAAASTEDLAAIETQVQSVVAEAGTLRNSLDDVQGTLAETVEAVKAQPAAAAVEAASADATAAEDGAETFSPGTTALFSDGALRLFVSRIDADAKAVRVSVAGQMETLPMGASRMFAAGADYCRITANEITASGIAFASLCGDELPPPEGISAGETAIFADGGLRVFASLIGDREARLSLNGEMASLGLDRSVPVLAGDESCRVYLDALDRGHAMVSALCGADVPVSVPAGPGQTVTIGDGAARVFVAAVQDDTARFAVNGQTVVSGAAGEAVTLADGCAITVEDVIDGTASFSYACAN